MSAPRYVVWVQVTLNAASTEEAITRVKKSVICLENSLRYADPDVWLPGHTLIPPQEGAHRD